jgi:hypothetical protein
MSYSMKNGILGRFWVQPVILIFHELVLLAERPVASSSDQLADFRQLAFLSDLCSPVLASLRWATNPDIYFVFFEFYMWLEYDNMFHWYPFTMINCWYYCWLEYWVCVFRLQNILVME